MSRIVTSSRGWNRSMVPRRRKVFITSLVPVVCPRLYRCPNSCGVVDVRTLSMESKIADPPTIENPWNSRKATAAKPTTSG